MRRAIALLLAALLALTVSAPVSAVTFDVRAIVKENFERAPSDEPCVADEVNQTLTCPGQGNAGRFGQLTSSAVYDGSDTVTRTLTFADGSTIVLLEEYGDVVFPGASTDAPGALKSFGNPFSQTGTWEVIGATGALAGTTGSGDATLMGAGNTLQFWFTGTVTTP
jgi:hypothetical protein